MPSNALLIPFHLYRDKEVWQILHTGLERLSFVADEIEVDGRSPTRGLGIFNRRAVHIAKPSNALLARLISLETLRVVDAVRESCRLGPLIL
jgi:hypothetical protein